MRKTLRYCTNLLKRAINIFQLRPHKAKLRRFLIKSAWGKRRWWKPMWCNLIGRWLMFLKENVHDNAISWFLSSIDTWGQDLSSSRHKRALTSMVKLWALKKASYTRRRKHAITCSCKKCQSTNWLHEGCSHANMFDWWIYQQMGFLHALSTISCLT